MRKRANRLHRSHRSGNERLGSGAGYPLVDLFDLRPPAIVVAAALAAAGGERISGASRGGDSVKRWSSNLLCGLSGGSLLIFLLAMGIWVRSYFVGETIARANIWIDSTQRLVLTRVRQYWI